MKLSDYRSDYYFFSGKSSDVSRQLAFAGIAIIWIFKINSGNTPILPSELHFPIGVLVVALALDLFQYVFATLIWGIFWRVKENRLEDIDDDPELSSPSYFQWPQMICFWSKHIAVLIAYIHILKYLFNIWNS